MERLVVVGARQHNLKNVSISLPRGKLIVFTGPSGSGKSSLAFDTIYAEGQRRYVESLSAYARQFLEQLAKPDVERIEGLSPAIAIEQRPLAKSPRSTVGTVTEVSDYLRLLYARTGEPHCPQCGKPIEAQTVQQMTDQVLGMPAETKLSVLAPICRAQKGALEGELERLRREGFVRARLDGVVIDLSDGVKVDPLVAHDLDVVIDRIVVRDGAKSRVTDSVELALKIGHGLLRIAVEGEAPFWMSERFACIDCGIALPPLEPRLFSFNGPHGACPMCDGLGARDVIDEHRVVGDPARSLREGALVAWGMRGSLRLATEVKRAVDALGIDPDLAFRDFNQDTQQRLLFGFTAQESISVQSAQKKRTTRGTVATYEGIVPRLQARLDASDAGKHDEAEGDDFEGEGEAEDPKRFAVRRTCTACKGARLRPEALAVTIDGRSIAELGAMPLPRLREVLVDYLEHSSVRRDRERTVARPLLAAVTSRLGFLIEVGLAYLSVDRGASTLSSGEGQRIRLATQIGAALVGVLYVLDEPSVGLHARDNTRLIAAETRLRDLGNTVIVVEHDREAMLAADVIVDLGPGAGVLGGEIVAYGTATELMHDPRSVTGPWLSGAKRLTRPTTRDTKRTAKSAQVLTLRGARAHNLKNVNVEFPIGLLTAVTGVSGSGKSSLVIDTLLPVVRQQLYGSQRPVGDCDAVLGLAQIDKVVSIDQAPIGRTPRSNPATYTGVFGLLRELFASLPDARARGYKPGRFSFNVKGGRCEACAGDGVLKVEMHFLPDVYVACETCQGSRYNRETLEIRYRGYSVAETLALTVDAARDLFTSVPRIREKLDALARVGLGYVTLGQAATTLSGGEAQRVKLARELAKKATGKTLYILDEPTTGLHFTDIEILLEALAGLRDQGNTVIMIEHNLDVVACADWVIDIGPEGGDGGGTVVVCGTPETVAECNESHTGTYLREIIGAGATYEAARHAKPTSAKSKKAGL